ncbi:hypothetical protein G0X78_12570 [Staphylococcus aureus]|nr:hypothetical protein [Staphylococcus aureus]NGJ21031.1 hypothetical protein [Staphylococcus aureus]
MEYMRKTPFVVLGISFVILFLTQFFEHILVVGILLLLVGLGLLNKEMDRQDCLKKIKEINQDLKELDFTDLEIKERQNELMNSTKRELKQIKRETEEKLAQTKKEEFFDPLKKKDKY